MTRLPIALCIALLAGLVAAPGASAATRHLYAFMDGRFELQGGDKDGHARVGLTFDTARGRVCYDLRKFKLETPQAMHIHKGRKGTEGDVVVTLIKKPTGAGRGRITGCVNGVSRATIAAILANPAGYYINVHTAAYPAGSARGQLTTRELV